MRRCVAWKKTRDISSGGVCFLSSGDNIGIGEHVDYMITLSGSNPPVRIRCLGKGLRSQKAERALLSRSRRHHGALLPSLRPRN